MSDRELLELAAMAAGYIPDGNHGAGLLVVINAGQPNQYAFPFSPLTDDGDALRLAVKLGIKVTPYPIYEHPKHSVLADRLALSTDGTMGPQVIETYRDDSYAATRRAIVRAAAEIGKNITGGN